MNAKFEFILGCIVVIVTLWKEWNNFSWTEWIVGIIALVFFWGIWVKENSKPIIKKEITENKT